MEAKNNGRCNRLIPWLMACLDDEPQLAGLIEQYGHDEVWFASVDVLGCPPTSGLGSESLVAVSSFLESRFQK